MVNTRTSMVRAVLVLMVGILLLAACGGGGGSSQEPAAGDTAETADGGTEAPAGGAEATWQHQTIAPESWFGSQVQTEWANAVAEATDGQLTIEMFYAASLGVTDSQVFRAVGGGVLQSADMFGASTAGELPTVSAMELPFYLPPDIELRHAVSDELRPTFEEEFAARGVKLLAVSTLEPRNIYTTTPVETLDDLEGLNIRSVGAIETTLTDAIGASPVAIDAADLYTSLQQGVVDGYWLTYSTTRDFNFHEVVDYAWEVAQGGATWFLVANLDGFEALPPEVQDTVVELGLEAENQMWETVPQVDDENRAWLVDNGMTVNEASEDDLATMRAASQPIWDEWVDTMGNTGVDMFATMEAVLEEQGYE